MYECYVSPFVTSRLVEATLANGNNPVPWNPLPPGAFPVHAVPQENLLEYRATEGLGPDGLGALQNVVFPNNDQMSGRLHFSSELLLRVSAVCEGMRNKHKMHEGFPRHKVHSSALGYLSVEHQIANNVRLSVQHATLYSPVSLGPSACNIVGIYGQKRERNQRATGCCYLGSQGILQGWLLNINNNFVMDEPFQPTQGIDRASLRESLFKDVMPATERTIYINSWIERNFKVAIK